KIVGVAEYATSLYSTWVVKRYLGYLRTVLEAMVRNDKAIINSLLTLSEEERAELEQWKANCKTMPAPKERASRTPEYEAPEGEIEATVARIWADVLKVDRVGREDNFFELGGRSLLAVQVAARLRQVLDVEVEISELFARPLLSDFA